MCVNSIVIFRQNIHFIEKLKIVLEKRRFKVDLTTNSVSRILNVLLDRRSTY